MLKKRGFVCDQNGDQLFEEFRSQVAIRKKKLISRPEINTSYAMLSGIPWNTT